LVSVPSLSGGENVTIEYRSADEQFDRLSVLATELVRRKVAVIVTGGGPDPALAAKAATTTIPIVFLVGDDPAKLGLVASLARPGGNVTGVNFFAGELVAKQLALLHELVPAATRVAVLVNPAIATTTESTLRDVQPAALAMGLQIQVLNADTSREINVAFATIMRERPMPSSSAPVHSSSTGASSWPSWLRSTGCQRYMGCAHLPKLAA
jgi:putative tryptophan/tyrosine transport system substrate-binding protein